MADFLVPPVHQNRFLSLRQFFPETWAGLNPRIYICGLRDSHREAGCWRIVTSIVPGHPCKIRSGSAFLLRERT